MDLYFAESSRRTARKVVVNLGGYSINAVCSARNFGAGEARSVSGDARNVDVNGETENMMISVRPQVTR
jgi:hypothetical protein